MRIFHIDENGTLIGEGRADADPLQPGAWLIPAQATTVEPPQPIEGSVRRFVAGGWEYHDLPEPEPEPSPVEPEPVPETETPPPMSATDRRRVEILSALAMIDAESMRPARAVALAVAAGQVPAAADVAKLAELEQRAQDLRNELRLLP